MCDPTPGRAFKAQTNPHDYRAGVSVYCALEIKYCQYLDQAQ